MRIAASQRTRDQTEAKRAQEIKERADKKEDLEENARMLRERERVEKALILKQTAHKAALDLRRRQKLRDENIAKKATEHLLRSSQQQTPLAH
jgi:hypothetical protein